MTRHLINLFALRDAGNLRRNYRLMEVTNLPRNDQFAENIQRLVGMVAKETRRPACVYQNGGRVYLATTADAEAVKREWRLIPNVAVLVPDPKEYQLDYGAISPGRAAIALNLLRYELRTALSRNAELWNDSPGSFYLRTPKFTTREGDVDVLEGFVFRFHYLQDVVYLSIDPTVRYVDRRSMSERLNAGEEFRHFRFQHFLYRNGHKWYRVQLHGLTNNPISKQLFVHESDDQPHDVYSWVMNTCQPPHPDYIKQLDPNSPAVIYRYPQGGKDFYGAAALCFKTYRTDDPRIHELHSRSIVTPADRLLRTREFIRKYFQHVNLQQGRLMFSEQPLSKAPEQFDPPDLLFGGGKVLHAQQNNWDEGVPLKELGRRRMDLLLDPQGGVLTQDGLQKQYVFIPMSLHRSVSKIFHQEFTRQMERLLSQRYSLNPILFDDRSAKNLRQQVEAIKKAVEENKIDRGSAILILPDRSDPHLHNFIKRELFEVIHFQCVQASNLKRYFNAAAGGDYRIRDDWGGRFISYTRYTALGMLIVNHKWPFALNSPLHHDVYIGIDVLNTMAGFTYVYNGGKNSYFRHYQSRQAEKLSKKQVFSVLSQDLQRDLSRLNLKPRSIVIHRDGRSFAQEEEGFFAAVERLKQDRVLPTDVLAGVVEIHKTTMGRLRLYEERGGETQNPRIGSFFTVDDRQGIVCNTGWPFRFPGTVAPLHVAVTRGDLDIRNTLADVFALSQLAWSAPDKSSRLPITIKLGDMFLQPVASEFDEEDALYGGEEPSDDLELVGAGALVHNRGETP
jgi:hypothetical protein